MRQIHPLPRIWLVTDRRNDAGLEQAIARMPRGSGLIFRHYHLAPEQRRTRFAGLARQIRARGGLAVLAGDMAMARMWGADGAYGPPGSVGPGAQGLRLIPAHSLREIGAARRARADAILLSPAFPTRSHPGARTLGVVVWRGLAQRWDGAAIALGGMTGARAKRLDACHWAAIDGLNTNIKKGG
jgi:thiamine-phosphate pyrophosphorylase